MDSLTPIEITQETLELGEKLGISVIDDKTPAIRRITRSLGKEFKKKQHYTYNGPDMLLIANREFITICLPFWLEISGHFICLLY